MSILETATLRHNNYNKLFSDMNIFRQLYDYPPLDTNLYFNDLPDGKPLFEEPYMGLINDPNYCDFVDSYNILHPSNIHSTKNIFTDYNYDGLARQTFKKVGNDVMDDSISKDMP